MVIRVYQVTPDSLGLAVTVVKMALKEHQDIRVKMVCLVILASLVTQVFMVFLVIQEHLVIVVKTAHLSH